MPPALRSKRAIPDSPRIVRSWHARPVSPRIVRRSRQEVLSWSVHYQLNLPRNLINNPLFPYLISEYNLYKVNDFYLLTSMQKLDIVGKAQVVLLKETTALTNS
jgi:hypothetical protein